VIVHIYAGRNLIFNTSMHIVEWG